MSSGRYGRVLRAEKGKDHMQYDLLDIGWVFEGALRGLRPVEMRYEPACTNCGMVLPDSMCFCSKCWNSVAMDYTVAAAKIKAWREYRLISVDETFVNWWESLGRFLRTLPALEIARTAYEAGRIAESWTIASNAGQTKLTIKDYENLVRDAMLWRKQQMNLDEVTKRSQ